MINRIIRFWITLRNRLFQKPSLNPQQSSASRPLSGSVPQPPEPSVAMPPSQVGQMRLEMGVAEPPQYQKKTNLLTYQERRFYTVLQQVVDNRYHIFTKVRMADVIWLANEPHDRKYHNNQVLCKHFDFVLCNRAHFCPIMVIELDDSSHSHYDRRASDAFKEKACEMAALPLLRIKVQSKYDVLMLHREIDKLVHSPGAVVSANS